MVTSAPPLAGLLASTHTPEGRAALITDGSLQSLLAAMQQPSDADGVQQKDGQSEQLMRLRAVRNCCAAPESDSMATELCSAITHQVATLASDLMSKRMCAVISTCNAV
jgi:hypothetical protein